MSDYDFLWDGSLSNDEIIEAASSGATRDEWQYIDPESRLKVTCY